MKSNYKKQKTISYTFTINASIKNITLIIKTKNDKQYKTIIFLKYLNNDHFKINKQI